MRRSILSISMLSITTSFAGEVSNHFSFQGYTGVINTPNAQVLNEGEAVLHYNNQFDNHLRFYDYNREYSFEDDYSAGIGFFKNFEASGRLVEAKGYARDLSANVKYKLPFENHFLPSVAIGVQDLGGEVNFYTNRYIALDKSFWDIRLSAGYGDSDTRRGVAQRMDGFFGALEYQPFDWVSVMAENDGEENHAGLRVSLPQSWTNNFRVDGMVVQNLTESETSFAVNLSIPLISKYQKTKDIPNHREEANSLSSNEHSVQTVSPVVLQESNRSSEPAYNALNALQQTLVAFGFENVSVGEYSDTLYVACENTMFDHNELDALGYLLGTIAQSDAAYKSYAVTLLKSNLETITILGHIPVFKEYLQDPSSINYVKLERDFIFMRDFDTSKVKFLAKRVNSSFFKPRIEFSPGLITTVGTEVGVFDYLASLRTNVYATLYDGLMVSAMYEVPFANSKNFDEGAVFYNTYRDRMDNQLVNAMVHQTLHYDKLLNTTSLGQFRTDYSGIMNQSSLISESGTHGLNLKLGNFENNDDQSDKRDLYIGSYRYFYEPLELFTEIGYGKYWNQDTGAMLSFKRFFNDASIALYYKNTSSDDYVGFELSFPLTVRKTHKAYYAQVKGKSDFNYGLRTTVNQEVGVNLLNPAGGIDPKSDFEVTSYYLNRDRLNPAYIRGNIKRLREAYLRYQ